MKAFAVAFCGFVMAAPAAAQMNSGGVMTGSGAELSGQSETPESSGAGNARAAEGERRICRRIETDSTSRMATRRVCRTADEWRQAQRSS